MKYTWILAGLIATTSSIATTTYADNNSRVAAAGALGSVVGAVIGQQVAGQGGANVGAAIGGAGGAISASNKDNRKEAAIGAGLGSYAGAAMGSNMYGGSGQLIGAAIGGAGGAALGHKISTDKSADKNRQYRQVRYNNRSQWRNNSRNNNGFAAHRYYRH